MDLAQLIKQARSCRRFDSTQPIPAQTVRTLVDLARLVPSAGNLQPLRYRIITDAAERQRIFPHTKWAGLLKDWGGPTENERPTAYIVILGSAGKNTAGDVGIAGQTIQLLATSLGYAACMLGAIDKAGIQRDFGLPAEFEVQLVVALGKPAESIVLEPLPANGNTAYWRSPDGVHHVPKRGLQDVLIG